MRKTGQNERYDEQGEFCPVPTADVLSWESFVPLRTWLLADLVRRVTRGCHVLQEQAEEPEEEGRVACGDCRCGVGGGLTGGWREACWGGGGCGAGGRWQGQVVLAARLEGGARPAGPGRASRRRAERSSRRGRRAGGQASRRTEVWRRGAARRSGSEGLLGGWLRCLWVAAERRS